MSLSIQEKLQTKSFKAILLSLGQIFTSLTTLISAALLSRILVQDDYATYRQTLLIVTTLSPFITFGLPAALFYLMPNDSARSRAIVIDCISISTLVGFTLAILIYLKGGDLAAYYFENEFLNKTLKIYSPYILFFGPATLLSAVSVIRDRVGQMVYFTIGSRLLFIASIVFTSLVFRSVSAILIGSVLTMALSSAGALYIMLRATDGRVEKPSLDRYKRIFSISIPMAASQIVAVMSRSIDKIVVGVNETASSFAIYVNGAFQVPVVPIILSSVTSVIMPDLTKHYSGANYEEALTLWGDAALKCAGLIFPIGSICFVFAPEIMVLVFGHTYEDSSEIFRLYLLVLPLRIVSWDAMFIAAGKPKVILRRSFISLLSNIFLSIIFASLFGYFGPAIATLLVLYSVHILISIPQIARLYGSTIPGILPWIKLASLLTISIIFIIFSLPNTHELLGIETSYRLQFVLLLLYVLLSLASFKSQRLGLKRF